MPTQFAICELSKWLNGLKVKRLKGLIFSQPNAFTMAEILLSLTIIGVVAAITLPSLTGNINERTWNTQRKALFARMSQALALMPSLNSYGTLQEESSEGAGDAVDTAAETFITEGLSKVLKINNICDSKHLADCGLPATITPITGTSAINLSDISTLREYNSLFKSDRSIPLNIKAAAFETQNNESILLYYNPNCTGDLNETTGHASQPKMCANFVYDLNGTKGPNTVGKDIGFITALYPTDPVIVAPIPLATNGLGSQFDANSICKALDNDSRLPNREELYSLFYNIKLTGIPTGYYWSASVPTSDSSKAWVQYFTDGMCHTGSREIPNYSIRCIKR